MNRSDIVIAKQPDRPSLLICKRIVAMEGDDVPPSNIPCKYCTVPKGHVWLEGDNPDSSYDSRDFGPLPYSLIQSRVFFRIWPPARIGVIRWLHEVVMLFIIMLFIIMLFIIMLFIIMLFIIMLFICCLSCCSSSCCLSCCLSVVYHVVHHHVVYHVVYLLFIMLFICCLSVVYHHVVHNTIKHWTHFWGNFTKRNHNYVSVEKH